MNSLSMSTTISLIKLRDLNQGIWNVDTLYVLLMPGSKAKFERLAGPWGPDEIECVPEKEANWLMGGGQKERILYRLWWD